MNEEDKKMEAAREAAWTTYAADNRDHFDDKSSSQLQHLSLGFQRGFDAGYNARQPKPCVWKWQLGIMGYPGCQDGSGPPSPANGPYCHNCGGKIEESE